MPTSLSFVNESTTDLTQYRVIPGTWGELCSAPGQLVSLAAAGSVLSKGLPSSVQGRGQQQGLGFVISLFTPLSF